MITLLRRIRKSLILSGSARKYAVYAIGEILLVMIGILLALQVNNWNSQRIDRNQTTNYLRGLKSDVEANLGVLDRFLSLSSKYVEKYDSISQIRSGNFKIEDLHYLGIRRQTYFLKDDTYREIIANGHLTMLPDSLKSLMMDLNTFFRSVNHIDDNLADMLNHQHLKMAEYYEIKKSNSSSNYEVIPSIHADRQMALLTFKNYINICYDWMRTQEFFYRELQKRQLRVLDVINRHIAEDD